MRLTERVTYFGPLEAGDEVTVLTPGGGGWGPPEERDPHRVAYDVRDGLLTLEEAHDIYRVALVPDGAGWIADETRTAELRAPLEKR